MTDSAERSESSFFRKMETDRVGREVWLTVTGEQKDADGRKDRNSTQCRAWYEKRGDLHIFEYRETDPQSGAFTDSRLVFSKTGCSIERTGVVSTMMRFEPERELECMYETGFGSIPMKIFTKRLAMREVGSNFHGRVSYDLHLRGGDPMDCAVTIKAEPV